MAYILSLDDTKICTSEDMYLEYLHLFMGVVVFVVYHCQLKVGKHFETGQHAAGGRARVMA